MIVANHTHARIAIAAILLVAACDAAGPDDDAVEVEISVVTSEPTISPATEHERARIECTATLTATATGAGDAVAVWKGGELRFYAGMDRTTPFTLEPLSTSDVQDSWQGEQLATGQTATAVWSFWATTPFILEAEFEYTSGSSSTQRIARTQLECGLDVAGEAPSPPVLSDLVIEAPNPFQPADSFTVSYVATAPGGLWMTRIVLDGAYDVVEDFGEGLAAESHRTIGFSVPSGVRLGDPIRVSAQTIDAFGQTSAWISTQSASLVDVTPPYEFMAATHLSLNPPVESSLLGQFAVGDMMHFLIIAADNHELGEAMIEIGTVRRRIALDGAAVYHREQLEVQPDWIGTPGLAVSVTDAQGLSAPRHEAHPDSIRVFPVNPRPTASWSGPGSFTDAAWDEVRDRLYLTNGDRPEVLIVSTATMTTEGVIPLPAPAAGVDFTASGDSLILGIPDRGSIATVDLATGHVAETTLAPFGLSRPSMIRVLANGHAVFAAVESGSWIIADFDLGDASLTSTTSTAFGVIAIQLTRTHDRTVAGAVGRTGGCLQIYSTVSGEFGPCVAGSYPAHQLSVDPAGDHFLMGHHIVDVASGTVRKPGWGLPWRETPASATSSDGAVIYLGGERGLDVIRGSDGVVVERIPLPLIAGRVLMASDDSRLLTISNGRSTVMVQRVTLH